MYKKQVRLFKRSYMTNDNKNEAENKKNTKHGHKYTKYKMCLSKMMAICINPLSANPTR